MKEMQRRLLDMVKEIDAISRKHGVPYYLSGGSVIGALRHRGFIPWDDDIDILIDSRHWPALHKALMSELAPNRTLGCLDNMGCNPFNTVYRYCDTESTNIHKNELLGMNTAGIVIDIILLDSVPRDDEAIKEHLVDLCLYSDLVNPYYAYSQRFELDIPLAQYRERVSKEGLRNVLLELDARLRKHEGEPTDCYMVRWAAGPNVFPKEFFGTPKYVPFEDTVLPIPQQASSFLTEVYGDEWYEVPEPDNQSTHDTVFDLNRGFADYYAEYLPRIDTEKFKREYAAAKQSQIETAPVQRKEQKLTTQAHLLREKLVIQKHIAEEGIDLTGLLDAGDTESLLSLLSEYMAFQGSSTCLGGEMWDGLLRKFDPVYVDVGDDNLAVLIWLWMYRGQFVKAHKVLRARKIALKSDISPDLADISSFLADYRLANKRYYAGDLAAAYEIVSKLKAGSRIPIHRVIKLYIRLGRELGILDADEERKLIQDACQRFPEDGEFKKYAEDIKIREGEFTDSLLAYLDSYKQTRNGLIWLEIADLLREHGDACLQWLDSLRVASEFETVIRALRAWMLLDTGYMDTRRLFYRTMVDFALHEEACQAEQGESNLSEQPLRGANDLEGETDTALPIEGDEGETVAGDGDEEEETQTPAVRPIAGEKLERRLASFMLKEGQEEYFRNLLVDYRERRGLETRYIDAEIAYYHAHASEEFARILDSLERVQERDNSVVMELRAKCLLRLGRTHEAFSVMRQLSDAGCEGFFNGYLKRELKTMIRSVERAKTDGQRHALIDECLGKFADIPTMARYLVQFDYLPESLEDFAVGYLTDLFGGTVGRVKYSPLFHYLREGDLQESIGEDWR